MCGEKAKRSKSICNPQFLVHYMYQLYKRLFSTSTMVSQSTVNKVQELVKEHKVFVASKSYCPYCQASKKLLNELDLQPYVIELDKESDGDEIQLALAEITGQRTVPNIFISGKAIGGNSDLQALYKKGTLNQLLAA